MSGSKHEQSGEWNHNLQLQPNGTLQARTDANSKATTYLYDGINRLTQKSYSDGTPTVNYFYDSNSSPNSLGRLSQVSNANGSTLYTRYDVLGRATTSTQVSQGHNYNFGYSYNLAGALLAETYPTGRTLWNGYDGAGRLAYLRGSNWVGVWTNYIIVAGYAAHGAPTSYVYGNNLWRNVTYNNRLQATSAIDQVNNNSGQQLLNLAWNWGMTNNNGNLQGITQNNGGPGYQQFLTFNQSFNYDALNRLSTATDSGGWSQAYQYDQWGNRWLDMGRTNGTPVNGSTPTTNVFDGNNRMSGGAYDSAGDQTVVNENTLVFDAENRMVSVTAPGNAGGGTETIQYDGNDHRISKTVAGTTTSYVYDVLGQLAVEYSNVPQPTPCATCYLSADQLGTPRLVTDGGANLIARHDYLPFGDEIGANTAGRSAQWGPANDNLNAKFTGQERDSETSLDYFNARYMGTSLGRFVSPDPGNAGADLKSPQTWNAYAYVGNSPLANIDPTGKDGCNLSNGTYEGSGSNFPCYDASQHYPGPAESPTSIAGGAGTATGSMIGYQSPELAEGMTAYLNNVRNGGYCGGPACGSGWVAGDDPLVAMAYGQTAQKNKEQYCESQNISAVNQVFGLGVSADNVTNALYRNGAWNFNFAVNAPQSSAAVGRYPLSTFTAVAGIGRSLHLPANPGPNPGPNVDPSVYGTDNQGNFNFTTHIDSAYSTWHTPIGAAIHGIVDVLLKTNHGC